MKALARVDGGYRNSLLLLVEFDRDVSMFKDEHDIIHLEYADGKLVIQDLPREIVVKGEFA
jgi:hypothetical protein